jgi:hypothetical protein
MCLNTFGFPTTTKVLVVWSFMVPGLDVGLKYFHVMILKKHYNAEWNRVTYEYVIDCP